MASIDRHFGDLRARIAQAKRDVLRGPRHYIPRPEPSEHEIDHGVPAIPEQHWHRHALLLAQTGGGKTNVIRWRIEQLLPQIARGDASLILMEPKGALTRELVGLARRRELGDRLFYLDPGDPAIQVNLFDTTDYSPQGIGQAIARIERIFSTITSDLTPFQKNVLFFSLRALFTISGHRNMDMLYEIIRNGIEDMPVTPSRRVRDFFASDFKDNKPRAREVIGRLNNMLSDPIFEPLFDCDTTTFDLFDATQNGSIIVINAGAASALYGRFWIEQADRTIGLRMALPEHMRVPTFFLIDEAHEWIANDTYFAHILDVAREAKLGMFVALQHLGKIDNFHVRNSLLTNTAIKFVAKTSAYVPDICRSLGNAEQECITTLNDYEFAFFGPNMRKPETVTFPRVDFPYAAEEPTRRTQTAEPPVPPAPEETVVDKTKSFETSPYDLEPHKPKPRRPRADQKPAEPPTGKVEPEQRRDTEGGTGWS